MAYNFNLGRGTVTVGGTNMGNCNSFSFRATANIVEHVNYNSGLREVEYIIVGWNYEGSFETDTLSSTILKKGMGSAATGGSDAVYDVVFTGAAGLSGGPTVTVTLPGCHCELTDAALITDTEWIKPAFSFKGSTTGTKKITVT